jgi:hypothetical protein
MCNNPAVAFIIKTNKSEEPLYETRFILNSVNVTSNLWIPIFHKDIFVFFQLQLFI